MSQYAVFLSTFCHIVSCMNVDSFGFCRKTNKAFKKCTCIVIKNLSRIGIRENCGEYINRSLTFLIPVQNKIMFAHGKIRLPHIK